MRYLSQALVFAACLIGPAAFGASAQVAAGNDCIQKIKDIQNALQRAEAPGSTGQIEACIPANDKNKNTQKIFQELTAVASGFDQTMTRYYATEDKVNQVTKNSASGVGNICGAPDEIKGEVTGVNSELSAVSSAANKSEALFEQAQQDFTQQYKGRFFKLASASVKMPANCGADTHKNVLYVLQLFQAGRDQCEKARKSVGETSNSVGQLNEVLSRGCQKGKPHCEDVAYAGNSDGYHYGIDHFDEYGTLVKSEEFTVSTLQERNANLLVIRKNCAEGSQ